MPRRLIAAALTAAALTAAAPLAAPASAKPCELGCILKCIDSTIVKFCPPFGKV